MHKAKDIDNNQFLEQEFTHAVKTERNSNINHKKSLAKLFFSCLFILLSMIIIFLLVFGISVAKKT